MAEQSEKLMQEFIKGNKDLLKRLSSQGGEIGGMMEMKRLFEEQQKHEKKVRQDKFDEEKKALTKELREFSKAAIKLMDDIQIPK